MEGDIEYAVSAANSRPFLFINNAADHATAIHTMLRRLEDLERPAMLVLGERLNEWRQGHGKLAVKEFQIEPLSEPEISRLIDLLGKHSELGALAALPRDIQIAAVRQKHGKELLVALREVTEGRSFDAILEDEFHGIQSEAARRLYLAVCCFYQQGALVRDDLLAQILDMPVAKLYENTADATEGVIIYEEIDSTRGTYAARARHRTIAAVVWERCALAEEKDSLLRSALSKLNLNYGIDRTAFESFVRSDHAIDQIRTLEGKINFFETACRKDPDSPYARQHYARMLLREGKTDLALGQIDAAIKMDSRVRVLHHTRGMILMELALSADSPEIGRRRLAQSEGSFRHGISLYSRDEYCYQGLAQLYIGWARRTPSLEESALYITKAEEVISEGLRQVRVRDGLWIESSNIQAFLGDEPSRIHELEQAVRASPGSIVPRYILGRVYGRSGNPQAALDILEPVIKNHPNEFRSFVEYALALALLRQSYNEPIAVLKLSTLYGFSDPRFIATLGGMLFMTEAFTEAKRVFDESLKHDFTNFEMNQIQFRPWVLTEPQTPIRMNGRVIVLKPGYVLIESVGFPMFFCPGSKFDGVVMQKGLQVSFQAAFSARGALAIAPLEVGVR